MANQRRRKKQITLLEGPNGNVEDTEGNLEEDSLYALPVAGVVLRRCKRKTQHGDWEGGAVSSCHTTSALAGSWLNLKKLTGADLELAVGSHLGEADESKEWKITTAALAARLAENSLELVDDGLLMRVLPKTE